MVAGVAVLSLFGVMRDGDVDPASGDNRRRTRIKLRIDRPTLVKRGDVERDQPTCARRTSSASSRPGRSSILNWAIVSARSGHPPLPYLLSL
jgi:hypothetical protein